MASRSSVADLERVMNDIAPVALAQAWDNVGLLAGDRAASLTRCMLCIDMTQDVLNEAIKNRCDVVIAYHPPLFKGIKSLRLDPGDSGPGASLVFEAIRAGVAIYSPHTALDAADNGTGDAIARLCNARPLGPLAHATDASSGNECKIVTFVPARQVDRVVDAMSGSGAGVIGNYSQCSFRIPGTGTFLGSDATNPVVGSKGRLETVDEVRVEVVCCNAMLPDAVAALRSAHPYEEPAFDIYPLAAKPQSIGLGRLAELSKPQSLEQLARTLAVATNATAPQIVGHPKRKIRKLAILVGSAGRLHEEHPIARDADAIITGEIRHHDALAYQARGYSAIALGHWCSERPVLVPLAATLKQHLPEVKLILSKSDRDPFRAV